MVVSATTAHPHAIEKTALKHRVRDDAPKKQGGVIESANVGDLHSLCGCHWVENGAEVAPFVDRTM